MMMSMTKNQKKVNLVIVGSQLVRKAHGKGLVVGASGETSMAAKIVRFPLVEFSTIKNLGTKC